MKDVDSFIASLRNAPEGNIFNPWWQRDEQHDDYSNSPEIRRNHLKFYLQERLGRCRYLLVGEALGYQGGHFSGIAMTSERMLLGQLRNKGIEPEHIFTTIGPMRTSREDVRKDGFSEPTATIVWGHLLSAGIDPYTFTIWNALPWHPYHAGKGMLSNRTPVDREFEAGLQCLQPDQVYGTRKNRRCRRKISHTARQTADRVLQSQTPRQWRRQQIPRPVHRTDVTWY